MMSKNESRSRRFLSGLVREPIPAALFTTGVLFTYGYATGIIFTIGDARQLVPVFVGIIFGAIVFSLVGFILKATRMNLISLTILSALFLVSAYVIMFLNSLIIDGTNFLIIAFLMTSPAMAISQLVGRPSIKYSVFARLSFGFVQAVLTIVFVFVFALEYELKGQVNLYLGPLIFLLLSIVYFAAVKFI